MARNQYGPANPNWRGGLHSDWDDGWLRNRLEARAMLQRVLTANLETNPPMGEEMQWALKVAREWPEWARDILRGLGWTEPKSGEPAGE